MSVGQATLPGGDRSLRSFNRFELKYLAAQPVVSALREVLTSRLDRDAHSPLGSYQVWSRYYDTIDLRCYWEKIDGLRFRRKLRVRHYGDPSLVAPETPVWVEIKQRVNRVTQKRRLRLAYREATALCAGQEPAPVAPADRAVVNEMLVLVGELDLRPVSVVGYVREPFVGRDEEAGVRVTIDTRIRGRDRDLDLAASRSAANRLLVRPDLAVVEVKVNDRVPLWLTDEVARQDLQLIRMSKYCQSIEAYGVVPRSVFHVPEGAEEPAC